MSAGARGPGEFCWIDVRTPRPPEARAFLAALLGWTYAEHADGSHRMRIGGRDIGALRDAEAASPSDGAVAGVRVAMLVEHAAHAAERVVSLGGTAVPPVADDERRLVACADPDGAAFDLWEPVGSRGSEVGGREVGAPGWFAVLATDVPRAAAFYDGVLGWSSETMRMRGTTYTTFSRGDRPVAGMLPIGREMRDARPRWTAYFTVRDVVESARQASVMGARLTVQVRNAEGVGLFCGIESPQGVRLHLLQPAR